MEINLKTFVEDEKMETVREFAETKGVRFRKNAKSDLVMYGFHTGTEVMKIFMEYGIRDIGELRAKLHRQNR